MASFSGFPARAQYTPIPNLFFSSLLQKIDDIFELKVVLHIFWTLFQKREYPRFVTFDGLISDATLMAGLGTGGGSRGEALERGLKGAVDRGLLLTLEMESRGRGHRLYFLNTEADRKARDRVSKGEIDVGALPAAEPYFEEPGPNIFALYEKNIGELTPIVSDMLKEAEKSYPEHWIVEAINKAVRQEVRRWSYIEAILRQWKSEGMDGGETRGHPEKGEDTAKYFRGRYGHLVNRRLP